MPFYYYVIIPVELKNAYLYMKTVAKYGNNVFLFLRISDRTNNKHLVSGCYIPHTLSILFVRAATYCFPFVTLANEDILFMD